MLATCNAASVGELFSSIPANLRPASFYLPAGRSELEVTTFFERLAAKNRTDLVSFIGGGFYDHFIPAAIDALASRSEFYTAYTPYQPELSQGTLQAVYEYQTGICRLTGLDVSNASLYDGGTALFEACNMATHATGRRKVVVDSGVNPIYRKMLYTYTANISIELVEVPIENGVVDRRQIIGEIDDTVAAVVLQNPNFFGVIDDHGDIVKKCHEHGVIAVQSVYPVALTLVKTPAEQGFDIATGEGQSLGLPLSFGGPYLGFMACRRELVRKMPGRLVGRTVDTMGREGFVLTLQAREQHIRREKATSNICSNQGLCALRAHLYMSLMGKNGLREVATLCLDKAAYARERIAAIPGVSVMDLHPTFNEFVVKLPRDADEFVAEMMECGYAAGFPLGRYYPDMQNCLLVAVTEKRTKFEIGGLSETMELVLCR